ncbi:MAG TPA: hypothetical protein VES95_05525 [Dermatophilaceae bacterium]|nr:hypothetical protein [Dermatophilaceae bacterium]
MTRHAAATAGHRRIAVIAGAALAAAALVPATATAAEPVDGFHFRGEYTHVEQEIGECLEVPFPIRHDGWVNARFSVRLHGTDGPEYYSLRATARDLYTNTDTGESFTGHSTFRDADLRVTDHGDGTITVLASGVRVESFRAPSGRLIGIDAGRATSTYVVDVGDPGDPDDDTVLSETHSEPVGASSLDGAGVCQIAATYLG